MTLSNLTVIKFPTFVIGDEASGMMLLAGATGPGRNEIYFVDPAIVDIDAIEDEVPPGAEVVALDADDDGVLQITEHLAGRFDLAAVHIIAAMGPAQVLLGTTELKLATLGYYSDTVAQWGRALVEGGDIVFHNDAVALGESGPTFMRWLGQLTRANVKVAEIPLGKGGRRRLVA